MPKRDYVCSVCGAGFTRQSTTVRDSSTVCCSADCQRTRLHAETVRRAIANYPSAEEISSALAECRTYAGAARKLLLKRETLKKALKLYEIDPAPFLKNGVSFRPLTDDELFVADCAVHRSSVRSRFKELTEDEYECWLCGQEPLWNDEPLTLQMDHINGDRLDNRRENLRWLCPNCHSQTDTYVGKSVRRYLG